MIHLSELLFVLCGLLSHLDLRRHRRNALFVRRRNFRGQWPPRYATRSGEAGPAGRVCNGRIVNDRVRHRAVVHLDVRDRDVVDRAVVIELVSAPVPALIPDPGVPVSVVDPAVVADMRSPVSIVIAIPSADISPITGSP